MKKALLLASSLFVISGLAQAESVTLGSDEYQIDRLIEREIGPGTTYLRLRLPDYPLNANVLMVDLTNPYNRIETTVAKESSRGTEGLVTAAQRQSSEGLRPIAAANANFWVVGSHPEGPIWTGITRNVSLRNGKLITESNQHRDLWDGGTMRTGIVGISYDKSMYIDYCTSSISITNDKIGTAEVHQCNKGVWPDEIGMYNSHYGATTQFMPINANSTSYIIEELNDATEVILDFDTDQQWVSAQDMTFEVKEVRTDAGRGTLGNHDLALVGRGDNRALLAQLAVGDKLTLNYSWTFDPNANPVTPQIENAIGGNALTLRNGELTEHNYNETYNSQVYSRTGYGTSADGKTLYVIVIDKSTDPVYGTSKGCGTDLMCTIAKHLGCWNMAAFDGGGSAEMMIDNQIINKTTEGTPRAVANGWMIYSIAPEDDNSVARLEFYDYELKQPIYASASPRVIAYNKYGAVVDYDYKDVTYSCSEGVGECLGNVFTAGSTACSGTLTAHCGNVSVTKDIEIINAEVAIVSKNILIDNFRPFQLSVNAITADKTYAYDPTHLEWSVEDPDVASIDSDGVLRGLANGTTTITGTIGDFSTQSTVTVEIANAESIPFCPLAAWTVKKGTGMSDLTVADDGTISFTFNKTNGYIDLSQTEEDFYSLPDEAYATFTSTVPVAEIQVNILPASETRNINYKLQPETSWAAGVEHTVDLEIEKNVDLDNILSYPLSLRRVRFTFETLSTNTGAQTFKLGGIFGRYKHFDGVQSVAIDEPSSAKLLICGNPAQSGSTVTVKAPGITAVAVYSITGALVGTFTADGSDYATIEAPTAGTYVVVATTNAGQCSAIMLVR